MSESFWLSLLSNTAIAALLGVCGFIVAHPLRRPGLAHAVFVLALLKLVTPPMFAVSVWPWVPPLTGTVTVRSAAEQQRQAATAEPPLVRSSAPEAGTLVAVPGDRPAASAASVASTVGGPSFDCALTDIVVGVWLLGSLLLGVLLVYRVSRFRGVLRLAQGADANLLAEVQLAQQRLGLRRAPRVLVCAAGVPPMVFAGWRGATLLVPTAIARQLDRDARIALWTHELAHIRRGDIWLRWFEAAMRIAMWWHPLCWWLSRELRDAEERACDAFATVGATSAQRRSYGEALLLIACDCTAPVSIPASPAVRIERRLRTWQRRLEDVMNHDHSAGSQLSNRLAVLLLAAVALPLAFAQQPQVGSEKATARLDQAEIEFRIENEPLEAWTGRLAHEATLNIVVEASAVAADRQLTTVRGLQLPKASVRRVLDVLAALTDLSWSDEGRGVIAIRARAAKAPTVDSPTDPSSPKATPNTVRCHGAFAQPGLVDLCADETVLSLLARVPLAKNADLGAVQLLRSAGPKPLTWVIDADGMMRTGVTSQNVMLCGGDVVTIPERLPEDLPPLTLRPGVRVRFVIAPDLRSMPGAEDLALLAEPQRVQRDGTIFVPTLGPVVLTGLSRDEVSAQVSSLLQALYKVEIKVWARLD